MFELKVYIWGL